MPAADALREPTIATIGRDSTASLPRTPISGGGSSIMRSRSRIVRLAERDVGDAEARARR